MQMEGRCAATAKIIDVLVNVCFAVAKKYPGLLPKFKALRLKFVQNKNT